MAAAAAVPGLNALLLPLLLSFGPSILQHLFGDPKQKLRQQIEALLNPKNISATTNSLYQNILGSPAYSSALGNIATGANQTGNEVKSSLAARGIVTTGTGAVLSGLVPSLVGSQQSSLHAGAYDLAHKTALEQIQQRIAALTGTSGPSASQQMFSGGLEAFQPYLQSWLRTRFPQLALSTTPTGTTVH
jgi:hypothetical protein